MKRIKEHSVRLQLRKTIYFKTELHTEVLNEKLNNVLSGRLWVLRESQDGFGRTLFWESGICKGSDWEDWRVRASLSRRPIWLLCCSYVFWWETEALWGPSFYELWRNTGRGKKSSWLCADRIKKENGFSLQGEKKWFFFENQCTKGLIERLHFLGTM